MWLKYAYLPRKTKEDRDDLLPIISHNSINLGNISNISNMLSKVCELKNTHVKRDFRI